MEFRRYLASAAIALCSPILVAIAAVAILAEDIAFRLFGRRLATEASASSQQGVSVVIPNWNGCELLASYLPSVIAAVSGDPANEIIVVDNASTDGSVEFLRSRFPNVRVLPVSRNLGFGGGCNAGVSAAVNEIVVLLNNDMRVDVNFLDPLLAPFNDPSVFSVACQIFFPDPAKLREETGLTQTWWERGALRVSHRADAVIDRAFPCAYAGGGSSAFQKRKFLELGGFDPLYEPFYYEDSDLGHLAWKRGWKVLYEPKSIVFHEHRGTIGRKFDATYINSVVAGNKILFCWKNIHSWRMLAGHFPDTIARAIRFLSFSPKHRASALAVGRAFVRLPHALKARWRAKSLAGVDDAEAFRRQQGAYFHDRFHIQKSSSDRLRLLFLSPYAIEPPVHGGAVFMRAAIESLSRDVDVHVLGFVRDNAEVRSQAALERFCASVEFVVASPRTRNTGGLTPRIVNDFRDREFLWRLHRTVYLENVDVVQIEYAMLAQYALACKHIPFFVFEHDIAFQSLGREFREQKRAGKAIAYMQFLRYELRTLKRAARIQTCSRQNAEYLLSFAPELRDRIDDNLRACIDLRHYPCVLDRHEPDTLLFLGSLSHAPNVDGLLWFLREVFAIVQATCPGVQLVIAGSGSDERISRLNQRGVVFHGFVPDAGAYLQRYAALICPILSGSGVRVKMIEAFASGIPVIATPLGAEGLAEHDGEYCRIANTASSFAAAVVEVLQNAPSARSMAARAREKVEREHDAATAAPRLIASYYAEIQRRRPQQTVPGADTVLTAIGSGE